MSVDKKFTLIIESDTIEELITLIEYEVLPKIKEGYLGGEGWDIERSHE